MRETPNLTGQRFGRLQVIMEAPRREGLKNKMWVCQCDCGKTKSCRADVLKKGSAVSCGCYMRENNSRLNRTHGMTNTPEYKIWQSMKTRCHDPLHPKSRNHAGKGIRVCPRWIDSFENFYSDMGRRPSRKHSIDRINNNLGYEPANCRWATASMQARNTSANRIVKIDEVSFCVADWCDLMGVDRHKPYNMVYWNKRSGIQTVDEAIRQLYAEWQQHDSVA